MVDVRSDDNNKNMDSKKAPSVIGQAMKEGALGAVTGALAGAGAAIALPESVGRALKQQNTELIEKIKLRKIDRANVRFKGDDLKRAESLAKIERKYTELVTELKSLSPCEFSIRSFAPLAAIGAGVLLAADGIYRGLKKKRAFEELHRQASDVPAGIDVVAAIARTDSLSKG